jgi:hypothetical protein
VVEADADLQDAVVKGADRSVGRAPQDLEGLVLLEEVARIELLDALEQLRRRRLVAARARGLAGLGLALGAADRLALAAPLGRIALRPWRRARSR